MDLFVDRVGSKIGTLWVVTDAHDICAVDYVDCAARMERLLHRRFQHPRLIDRRDPLGVSGRLAAYFDRDLEALDKATLNPGGTTFQRRVWAAVRSIRPGTVRSYGELARELGTPRAARAVGAANALNPIAIVIPCHRLVGSTGSLTGYAGGLDRKRWLLRHERAGLDAGSAAGHPGRTRD